MILTCWPLIAVCLIPWASQGPLHCRGHRVTPSIPLEEGLFSTEPTSRYREVTPMPCPGWPLCHVLGGEHLTSHIVLFFFIMKEQSFFHLFPCQSFTFEFFQHPSNTRPCVPQIPEDTCQPPPLVSLQPVTLGLKWGWSSPPPTGEKKNIHFFKEIFSFDFFQLQPFIWLERMIN